MRSRNSSPNLLSRLVLSYRAEFAFQYIGFSANLPQVGLYRVFGNTSGVAGVGKGSAAICQRDRTLLALGIGGAGVSLAAGTGNMAPNGGSNMPATSGTSTYSQTMM